MSKCWKDEAENREPEITGKRDEYGGIIGSDDADWEIEANSQASSCCNSWLTDLYHQ